jgi:hypothetical protein
MEACPFLITFITSFAFYNIREMQGYSTGSGGTKSGPMMAGARQPSGARPSPLRQKAAGASICKASSRLLNRCDSWGISRAFRIPSTASKGSSARSYNSKRQEPSGAAVRRSFQGHSIKAPRRSRSLSSKMKMMSLRPVVSAPSNRTGARL